MDVTVVGYVLSIPVLLQAVSFYVRVIIIVVLPVCPLHIQSKPPPLDTLPPLSKVFLQLQGPITSNGF